jgi:hypothetical protein
MVQSRLVQPGSVCHPTRHPPVLSSNLRPRANRACQGRLRLPPRCWWLFWASSGLFWWPGPASVAGSGGRATKRRPSLWQRQPCPPRRRTLQRRLSQNPRPLGIRPPISLRLKWRPRLHLNPFPFPGPMMFPNRRNRSVRPSQNRTPLLKSFLRFQRRLHRYSLPLRRWRHLHLRPPSPRRRSRKFRRR